MGLHILFDTWYHTLLRMGPVPTRQLAPNMFPWKLLYLLLYVYAMFICRANFVWCRPTFTNFTKFFALTLGPMMGFYYLAFGPSW
jgi:hypothetical protein